MTECQIHSILANERRRAVIERLDASPGTVTVRDLSTTIAAAETGESPPPARVRESVYTSLHQTHLPKLADAGFVESDREWVDVRLTDRAHVLEALLDDVTEPDPSRKKSAVVGFALGLAVGVLLSALFDATVLVPSVALPLADTKLCLVRRW